VLLFGVSASGHASQNAVFTLVETFIKLLSMRDKSRESFYGLVLLSRIKHLGVELDVGVRLVSTRTEYITFTLLRRVGRSRLLSVAAATYLGFVLFLKVSLSKSRLFLSRGSGVLAHFTSEVRKFGCLFPCTSYFIFIVTTNVEAITIAEGFLMFALKSFLLYFILLNLF
jgi:hypothetical protein